MDQVKDGLYYTKDHEWLEDINGQTGKVGLSDHAQQEMTEIVYVELPEIGKRVAQGDVIAVVESVKTVSDVYSPVSGEVIEVNRDLEESTELINDSPYEEGWIAVVRYDDPSEISSLMDSDTYADSL